MRSYWQMNRRGLWVPPGPMQFAAGGGAGLARVPLKPMTAPIWTPAIGGYIVFYDGARETYTDSGFTTPATTNGANVSGWKDLSGNNHHVTLGGGSCDLVTNDVNGHNTVNFPAGYLNSGNFTWNQPCDMWMVINIHDFLNTRRIITNVAVTTQLFQSVTSPNLKLYAGTSIGPLTTGTLDAWMILRACLNGASSILQRNAETAITADAGATAMGSISLGGNGGGATFKLATLIGYSTALSSGDATTLRNDMASRFGITL